MFPSTPRRSRRFPSRFAVFASVLAMASVSGCTDSAPVSFPSSPPDTARCPGSVLDHQDIQHPDLGAVRVFLVRRSGSHTPSGCVASVTGDGRALTSIGVDIHEKELRFATPASDATGNTFVVYNPGRYDGVLVLVPDEDGFEDIGWADPADHYRGGRFAHYHAELVGPGEDDRYAIAQYQNSCVPSCAEGATARVMLRWNGHAYLPAA